MMSGWKITVNFTFHVWRRLESEKRGKGEKKLVSCWQLFLHNQVLSISFFSLSKLNCLSIKKGDFVEKWKVMELAMGTKRDDEKWLRVMATKLRRFARNGFPWVMRHWMQWSVERTKLILCRCAKSERCKVTLIPVCVHPVEVTRIVDLIKMKLIKNIRWAEKVALFLCAPMEEKNLQVIWKMNSILLCVGLRSTIVDDEGTWTAAEST